MSDPRTILSARDLTVHYPARGGRRQVVQALGGVNFEIVAGETLALVGESGSGKSTFARAAIGLVAPTGGALEFEGQDLVRPTPATLRDLRRRVQMVFQDPFASLNPVMTVGQAIAEPLIVHRLAKGSALKAKVADCLRQVGLDPAVANRRPNAFSGGQRQRICIARAIACEPELIIADEPLSALDQSLAGKILELFRDLKRRRALTYLFISHDLNVVRAFADRVAVMYLGRVVELAPAAELFANPKHPYTQALLAAVPVADPKIERARRYTPLQGTPPSPADPPPGCHFHTRCPIAVDDCRTASPPMRSMGPRHETACHLAEPALSSTPA